MKQRRIADNINAVSSIHSNVTRALRVQMPTKPKRTVITAPPKPPAEVTSDFAVPMEMPSTSIVIAEPPSRPKRKAATKASGALKPLKRQRSTPSVTESDESRASMTTAAHSQHNESDFTVGPCSPAQSYPTQHYISPNYEGPEASMTVGEAERFYESDSD